MIQRLVSSSIRTSFLPALFTLCFINSVFAADWQIPYEKGSAADTILTFEQQGSIDAPLPQLFGGLNHVLVSTKASICGWSLQAAGSVAFGKFVPPHLAHTGSSNAQIQLIDKTLKFNIMTRGVSDLSGAIPSMSWNASSLIIESTEWMTPGTRYAYRFDFTLNDTLLNTYPDLFDSIKLTIGFGEETPVYNQSLKELLGVDNMTSSSSTVTVPFDYTPTVGPIEISWKANMNITDSHLFILGDGTHSLFELNNSFILFESIPEPSLSTLLAGGVVSLCLLGYRTRKQTAPITPPASRETRLL